MTPLEVTTAHSPRGTAVSPFCRRMNTRETSGANSGCPCNARTPRSNASVAGSTADLRDDRATPPRRPQLRDAARCGTSRAISSMNQSGSVRPSSSTVITVRASSSLNSASSVISELRAVTQHVRRLAHPLPRLLGELLHELIAQRVCHEVQLVGLVGLTRPALLTLDHPREQPAMVIDLRQRDELRGVIRRQAPERQLADPLDGEGVLGVRVQRVGEHVPRARGAERRLVLGRLGHQMRRARLQVLEHERMDRVLLGPRHPRSIVGAQLHVDHAVDERRAHRPHDRRVLGAVPRADHDRPLGQRVLADPLLVDQAVERLLDVMRRAVELVAEQDVGLVTGDHRRREEPRPPVDDLRYPHQILGRQLRPQQRHALHPERVGELLDARRLADARLTPDEHRPCRCDVQEEVRQLCRGQRDREMHRRQE